MFRYQTHKLKRSCITFIREFVRNHILTESPVVRGKLLANLIGSVIYKKGKDSRLKIPQLRQHKNLFFNPLY